MNMLGHRSDIADSVYFWYSQHLGSWPHTNSRDTCHGIRLHSKPDFGKPTSQEPQNQADFESYSAQIEKNEDWSEKNRGKTKVRTINCSRIINLKPKTETSMSFSRVFRRSPTPEIRTLWNYTSPILSIYKWLRKRVFVQSLAAYSTWIISMQMIFCIYTNSRTLFETRAFTRKPWSYT